MLQSIIGIFLSWMILIIIGVFVNKLFDTSFFKNKITKSKKCENYIKNYLKKHKIERERINRIKDEAFN